MVSASQPEPDPVPSHYFVMRNPDGTSREEADSVSTLETEAPGGPSQNCFNIAGTAESGPAIRAVTDPSASLRTQPVRPSRCAWPRVQTRKLTPCTLPAMRTNVALGSFVIAISMNACLVNLEHAGKIASVFPARRKAHRNHDKPRHRERNRSPFVRQPSPAIGDAGLIRNTREAPLGFLDPRQTTTMDV